MTLPQVLAELGLQREQLDVVGNYETGSADPRPAYHLEELEISEYACLGFACRMRLAFFNDELAEILVFPSDAPRFEMTIRWLAGSSSSLEQSFSDRQVRYRSGTSDFVGPYFAFGDRTRMQQVSEWVDKYD